MDRQIVSYVVYDRNEQAPTRTKHFGTYKDIKGAIQRVQELIDGRQQPSCFTAHLIARNDEGVVIWDVPEDTYAMDELLEAAARRSVRLLYGRDRISTLAH